MESEDDRKAVMTLNVPVVDKTREFEGLSNLKMKKKERHMKTLREFAKFLETTNENVVQKVLQLSREFRETMEVLDEDLTKFCDKINEDSFLIPKSEKELIAILETELKVKIEKRGSIVEQFAFGLDHTETERAEITGTELKALVDRLIAIAHQLPDEIEHIVEGEAFELNTEIITNKNAHAKTMAAHQIKQVVMEAEALQKWEDCRSKWRQLRHEKALNDFRTHIGSAEFTDPSDRQVFMRKFRAGQEARERAVRDCLDRLHVLNSGDINSDAVAVVQAELADLNVQEINAIQSCYNDLIRLQADSAYTAAERVEALRRELHVYGALKIEPDLHSNAAILQAALNDERLGELWRLGGGLKPEFTAQVSDLCNEDVVYDRMVVSMQARLELIVCSFTLKGVLEERGRLAQLEKVRGYITKMRTAPRSEVAGVLRSLLPDLKDVEEIEQIPALFKEQVRGVVTEITEELASVDSRLAAAAAQGHGLGHTSSAATLRGTAGHTVAGAHTASHTVAAHTTSATALPGGTAAPLSGTAGLGMSKSKRQMDKEGTSAVASVSADPTLVKGWNRKLGILYFGSDLPVEYQQGCIESLALVREQKQCNELVDAVVLQESQVKLVKLDKRYKKLIDYITTYLETQASMVATTSTNIGDFFLCTAKMMELHRQAQKQLDDKSADEIWDLKEEFRFEKEDREAAYEAACQKIRESTKQEELQGNFEEVLRVLEGIQQSYRNYHSNACFGNDRYPLMLIHELRGFIATVAKNFFLSVDATHTIVTEYERVFDQTIRFNRKYFDENRLAGGMERLPLPEAPPVPADLSQDNAAQPIELLSPHLRNGSAPPGVCAGSFHWVLSAGTMAAKFKDEGAFAPPEPAPGTTARADGTGPVPAEGEAGADARLAAAAPSEAAPLLVAHREPHATCPFVTTACTRLPMSAAQRQALDELELEEYEKSIVKTFIDLGDPADIPKEPEEPVKPVKGAKAAPVEEKPAHPLSKLSPEDLQLYIETKDFAARTKVRMETEAETSYILSHPPLDPQGSSWVRVVEIAAETVTSLVADIRDSIITSVEKETYTRVNFAEKQSFGCKAELTDQLEDQIRNHWPRRGRVETQIKQPREAELLGHKEKTWRHISTIQQKMIQAQESFGDSLAAGRNECNTYINDMTAQRNALSGDFKNLAFLQAIDVKARGISQSFQASSAERVAILAQIAQHETDAIMTYARDFRKICPPQVHGVEGGYSESEILEIEAIVEGQCAEIKTVSQEWQVSIKQLEEEQLQSLKCQEEFAVRYKKATQDVAMSEGLGQKYGAPRRRAQERIRTEVGRDERSAGKLDALLARLEFACAEAERGASNQLVAMSSESLVMVMGTQAQPESADARALATPMFTVGQEELYQCTINWNLLVQVRLSLQQRVKYLRIMDGAAIELPPLQWLEQDRIAMCAAVGVDAGAAELAQLVADEAPITLEAVFEEVDKTCRKETKQLYESEGLGSVLGAGGVPDALQAWLAESKEKLLGRNGHREKAWKRLWAQVQRSEDILARHLVAVAPAGDAPAAAAAEAQPPTDPADELKVESKYTTKLGAPAICLRSHVNSFVDFAKQDKEQKISEFSQLLKVWEKGREKHERMLRPRLGSPDMADELSQLDSIESQRSEELVENVGKFRTLLVRSQAEHLRKFLEDTGVCGKGLIQLLDSTLRQEQLQVPPDTAVPKKHMTLKKLRKAQRIREQVAQGGEDRSQVRMWDGVDSTLCANILRAAEDLVLDLGKDPMDTAVTSAAPTAAPVVDKRDAKKAAAPAKGAPPVVEAVVPPSLMSPSWMSVLKEKSAVKGQVSTAHRIVISERDAAVVRFAQYMAGCLDEIRTDYDTILKQESSWNERWKRQVEMLRQGDL